MFGNRPFQSLSSYVMFVTINNTCLSSIHCTTILVLSFTTSFSPTTKHFWNSVKPSLLPVIVSHLLVLFKCRNCNRSGLLYKLWTKDTAPWNVITQPENTWWDRLTLQAICKLSSHINLHQTAAALTKKIFYSCLLQNITNRIFVMFFSISFNVLNILNYLKKLLCM